MRGACKRAESECRFAHPKEGVIQLDDGSVTVCMDAIKGRCSRSPCRYFHPPLHLQAQIKAAQSRAVIAENLFLFFNGHRNFELYFPPPLHCCSFSHFYFIKFTFDSSSILQFYLHLLHRTYSHTN